MISISKITFIFLFASLYNQCFGLVIDRDQSDELIGVAVAYRHGDRGPDESFPNDPYFDAKYWPDGLGQILDAGKLNQFNLGKWLRSRYDGFLPQKYNNKDIMVRSSDLDRILLSAASNLAGLYYLTDESTFWQKNLPWDPIPIHTVPFKDIAVIHPENICPKFQALYNSTLYSPDFQNFKKEHANITSFIEEKTGWKIDELGYFETLYTVFYVYQMHDPSYLPEWANQIDWNELNYLGGLHFSIATFNTELQRLKVGAFFNNLHDYFNGIINGTNPKFFMVSGHDETTASILNTYGVFDYHVPEFAETIIWELYKSANNEVSMKVFLKTTKGLKELNIKQCEQKCIYDKYLETMQPILLDTTQWEKECKETV